MGQNFDADSLQRAKMSLFFSSNTAKEIQDKIKQRFGAWVIWQHKKKKKKKLGLPSFVGQSKQNFFNDLKEKLTKKLADWKESYYLK